MPLGVVNVAIVDAAIAGRRRFATGIGLGGATADTLHAAVAFAGIGQLVTARPDLVRALALAAAAVIVGYAVVAWRRRARPVPESPDGTTVARGALTGFVLTLPNPGALAAWGAVAAAVWPRATTAEAITLGVGVGVGSAIWFAALAYGISRVRRDHLAVRIIPKLALVALVAIALVGVASAVCP